MKTSWVSLHPEIAARGPWDTTIIEQTLTGTGVDFEHSDRFGGRIVIFPARHHASQDDFDRIQERIRRSPEIMVVAAGDEEGIFPWWELKHPNMRLWVQHPPARWHDRAFPLGPSPHSLGGEYDYDRDDFYFSGQVTHKARHDAVAFLRDLPRGFVETTAGFTQGVEPGEYIIQLGGAKLAPSPSGPVLADTFRLYEALENGCLPIVDDDPPHGTPNYWSRLYPDGVPFPIVQWGRIDRNLWETWLDGWPANANRSSSWWQQQKWELARRWRVDLEELFGVRPRHTFTVLVVTSPIPSHPSTEIIDQTLDSIRQRTDAPILILADGVRPEQNHLRERYEAYLHRLTWDAPRRWDATVRRFPVHNHQAAMTRAALREQVDTEAVLFVEHDAPLVGDIPMFKLAETVASGTVHMIRLHHETTILPDHQHLIEGNLTYDGVTLARTTQWSQRPHFANTDYYRRILDDYFRRSANTMIEDRMHGIVQAEGWPRHRIAIYMPGRDIKRSTHLDARADEPKYEDTFRW